MTAPADTVNARSSAPGHFGPYGGRFVPEALMAALDQLEEAFDAACVDPDFARELADLEKDYTGRPSPLTRAARFERECGGARIYFKREDLNHTGSHKINNVLGQALLASRMGKTRIIAETGAGQHGVASATAAALMGLECVVYMGKEDTQRQALNVARMQLLGATVVPVETGSQTLKDAINEAMRDWVTNVATTHYLLGTVTGPSPFPRIVRHFHSVIGRETREQILEIEGRLPDAAVACRRWVQRDGACSRRSSMIPRCAWSATKLVGKAWNPVDTRRDSPWVRRAFCTVRARTSCKTSGAKPSRHIRSVRDWITPAWALSTRGCTTRVGPPTSR